MQNKPQQIYELAAETASAITQSSSNWTAFLKTAAWNYKYPFQDQLLIYAQRPDATACAPYDVWNTRLHRWVRAGSKGIALIDDTEAKLRLRYVFDVSDTDSFTTNLTLWSIQAANQAAVIQSLAESYGDIESGCDLAGAFIAATDSAVEQYFEEALSRALPMLESGLFEEQGEPITDTIFKDTLKSSVAYMLFVRCGLPPELHFNEDDFKAVSSFNSLDAVSYLGSSASTVSETLLRQIERTIRSYQHDMLQPQSHALKQKNIDQNNERTESNVTELQEYGGLSGARAGTAGGENPTRQVRDAAEDLSQGTPAGRILEADAVGQIERTPDEDRQDREGTDRLLRDDTDGERPTAQQGNRPDGLGRSHGQPAPRSRRDGPDGAYLQLTLFPSEQEQIKTVEKTKSGNTPSPFSFLPQAEGVTYITQEEIDLEILASVDDPSRKLRIYEYIQSGKSESEITDFLRVEYNIRETGHDRTFQDGVRGYAYYIHEGMRLNYYPTYEVKTIPYKQMARRIQELIIQNRYITVSELEGAQDVAPQTLYHLMMPDVLSRIRQDEVYIQLRDRDEEPISAKQALDDALERVTLSMREDYPSFYKAYSTLPMFKEWLSEDVLQRTYQDYLIETKDMVSLHCEDADAPDWLRAGNIQDMPLEAVAAEQVAELAAQTNKKENTEATQPAPPPPAPETPRINYHITDDALGHGGAKTKYGYNAAAIRLVKQLEAAGRRATSEEQGMLARYVGWGGLPQAFDEHNSQWTKEFTELKALLTDDEYTHARASTLNAHYTSPTVIKAIYACVERMGFQTGNILEPAMGVGNFFGLLPESMSRSRLYGVELDNITGKIAKQLYQQANITVQGFEQTQFPDSFFDLAIGNVPFGSYGVVDRKYDKYHFFIHDYFFAKALDKVRPGGIIAFVTSKGTMDKQTPTVRRYIAERAELLGAIRLPNTAFFDNAGTQVTTDILFLQKRDRAVVTEPDWVHLGQTADGIHVNSYFAENPHMILGIMCYDDMMYGGEKDTTCRPMEGANLAQQLAAAITHIHGAIHSYTQDQAEEQPDFIPADPNVRNFSFAVYEGGIYYRENSRMNKVEINATAASRIKGMIEIRDCVRTLIAYQTEDYGDDVIAAEQRNLNGLYDSFTAKYGLLSSRANNMAFSDDSSYFLLCSLEVLDDEGNLKRKSDMFTKRTIRQRTAVTHVDTASEALAISIGEKAKVDLPFMQSLTGLSEAQLVKDLETVIYRNPTKSTDDAPVYETADEYLSGNVREKLITAKQFAELHPELYSVNVQALEAVQPKDLDASEIDVRLGATWVPCSVVKDFMFSLLSTPHVYRRAIDVHYSEITSNWNISGKHSDSGTNIKANVTYGTKRINAYEIIEETLNLHDVRIYDTVYEENKPVRVFNPKESAIAQQKQEAIKDAFKDWLWTDQKRRERLVRLYNDKFNSIRPREYDGSHIRFTGMNPEKKMRKHQVDAVARLLYGGNSLFAHCVGAGKTYEMTAAAMESKYLGLCQKSMLVVPNHLTEQWATDFLDLYPSANILVSTKKDFETANRKKFCARIATGDYDAVIIGQSQFEKLPISPERQMLHLQDQIDEITDGVADLKSQNGERFAIKQMEKMKKSLEIKLERLNDTARKDDVITFEELGIDRLFVDEADYYKNLFLYTKMRNVAGISQTEAQKASDMFGKCRYLDELTGGRGIVFATGTPISNSITEMYTMQRYLQYATLIKYGLQHFDCWASTFGETVTAIELAPEGTGYRAKTRFARFYNLPELMNMFKEVADIKTADMLNLPVPRAVFHNVAVKPSAFQQEMVSEFAERADAVRKQLVLPTEDNMLKITNDGRKLALDQRLINALLPDDEGSKINAAVEAIFGYWQQGIDERLTQLVFCDLSTPKGDGSFNVYDDVRNKLIQRDVPEDEIEFIHNAKTDAAKKELFAKVRSGQIRILIGSTAKMGAGTNVQDRLIALHDLDCPWRPRDLEQRAGRIIRQGNNNKEVHILRYVTENTFDAYLYQILENKQRFIAQIMTSKSPVRSAEDIDETALSYAEVKALATGNPYIKEKMDLDIQVSKLKMLKASHLSQRYALEDSLIKHFPQRQKYLEERIAGYERDLSTYQAQLQVLQLKEVKEESKFAGMTIHGIQLTEKATAGNAILEACMQLTTSEPQELGSYMGFEMILSFDAFQKQHMITLQGVLSYKTSLGSDAHGNITRINNLLHDLPYHIQTHKEELSNLQQQIETAKEQIQMPFVKEEELQTKSARLAELNVLLNMDKVENEFVGGDLEVMEGTQSDSPTIKETLPPAPVMI